MKKYFNLSLFYLILGLALGVFYREFTKFNSYTGDTILKALHGHILILGFFFFLFLIIIEKNFNISSTKNINIWLILYNISFIYTIITMIFRGVLQVLEKNFAVLSHIAGLGHFLLGVSLIYFMVILSKSIKLTNNTDKIKLN